MSFSVSRYGEPATFGDFIKKARLEKGLKQSELAAKISVDEMTVVNWERYSTIPTRKRDKTMAVYAVLGLDYRDMVHRFAFSEANDGSGRELIGKVFVPA